MDVKSEKGADNSSYPFVRHAYSTTTKMKPPPCEITTTDDDRVAKHSQAEIREEMLNFSFVRVIIIVEP